MTYQSVKRKVRQALKNRDIVRAAIFGSYARGEAKKDSDLDLLVSFKPRKSLLDLVRLKFELEKILGKKVDILTFDSIHPRLKKFILKDLKIIYEERP